MLSWVSRQGFHCSGAPLLRAGELARKHLGKGVAGRCASRCSGLACHRHYGIVGPCRLSRSSNLCASCVFACQRVGVGRPWLHITGRSIGPTTAGQIRSLRVGLLRRCGPLNFNVRRQKPHAITRPQANRRTRHPRQCHSALAVPEGLLDATPCRSPELDVICRECDPAGSARW